MQRIGSIRRVRRALVAGLFSLLLVAALIVEGRSALYFHTLTPWASPGRMHVCDRDYAKRAHVSAAVAKESVAPSPLLPLARGALWQTVYGGPVAALSGARCGTVLYLPEGDGYRDYELIGGP